MSLRHSLLLLLCLWLPLAAQEHSHGTPTGQLGTVHFATSCSPAAQKQFEQGVAMLHSFWYEEAAKTFSTAGAADPKCAIAWWGVAMSYWHPLWAAPDAQALQKGSAAVEKAQAIGAKTDRERGYVAAIAAFYKDYGKVDHDTRALAYEKAMEQLSARYPDDREATIFYALALRATAPPSDKTYANQRKAGALLEKIFVEQPQHPGLAHYIIHCYDYPALAERALPAARRYAKIAPGVPHALHMPSHIFVQLGLWQEAIASNLASRDAGRAYEQRTHMAGTWDQTLHAMDYLAYSYLQTGQEKEAQGVMDDALAVTTVVPANRTAWYAVAAIPARVTVERRRWAAAAALKPPAGASPEAESITWWARAMGAAHQGDLVAAQGAVEKLKALAKQSADSADPRGKYWAGEIEIGTREAEAWIAHARGTDDEALRLMRSAVALEDATDKDPVTPGAAIPARELLGDLLLENRQPAEALAAYQKSLESSPNRFNGLYGAARAAGAAGRPEVAKKYYAQMLQLCPSCRADGPELREAKAFITRE